MLAVMHEAATSTYVDVGAGGGQFLWRTTLSGERIARMRRVRTTRHRKRPRSVDQPERHGLQRGPQRATRASATSCACAWCVMGCGPDRDCRTTHLEPERYQDPLRCLDALRALLE